MSTMSGQVRAVMASPVHTVEESAKLTTAEQILSENGFSALPVVDAGGALSGVISRTDLLRAGRTRMTNGHRRKVLALPDAKVREFMTLGAEVVGPDAPLHEAARRMVRDGIHRLYVVEDGKLQGVFTTRQCLEVVAETKNRTPIKEIMSKGVVVIRSIDPISLAVDRMTASHHHGLVVVDEGWPVGMFTQAEALAAKEADPGDAVDLWMDASILCLPLEITAFRAAQQASASRARTVLAVDGHGLHGIVTGLDFAGLLKQS